VASKRATTWYRLRAASKSTEKKCRQRWDGTTAGPRTPTICLDWETSGLRGGIYPAGPAKEGVCVWGSGSAGGRLSGDFNKGGAFFGQYSTGDERAFVPGFTPISFIGGAPSYLSSCKILAKSDNPRPSYSDLTN